MISFHYLICMLVSGVALWGYALGAEAFQAGAAKRDITPQTGFSHYRGASTGAHDPLYARALVMRQGDEMGALVISDIIGVSRELSMAVRERISKQTGIPFANISVTGTHTHAGPRYQEAVSAYLERAASTQKPTSDDANADYGARLVEQMAGAAVDAWKAARPVNLRATTARQDGLAFNRRFLMKDGQVRFNPGLQNPGIVRPVGPVDPEVGIVLFGDAASGKPLASLTVFALHLDTVGGSEYSADYPVYLSQTLKKQFGGEFVSLFGTGTCGNINHIDVSRPGPQRGHGGRTREIGQTLAATVSAALGDSAQPAPGTLRILSEAVLVPLQNYTEEELAWAESDSAKSPYPGREFLQQRRRSKILSLRNLREKEAIPPSVSGGDWTLPLEVHAFRLSDDTAVVTLPGEVFVELGLAIKKRSPFRRTLVIELANTSIAYVPNRQAFAQGDYEVINSRVQPGGGEMLVEAALKILDLLK